MQPQENPQAVTNWILWLNRTFPPGPWIALQGFSGITRFDYDIKGNSVFNPNLGFPVKAFWNQSTGEIKVFDARKFLYGNH